MQELQKSIRLLKATNYLKKRITLQQKNRLPYKKYRNKNIKPPAT